MDCKDCKKTGKKLNECEQTDCINSVCDYDIIKDADGMVYCRSCYHNINFQEN